LTKIKKTETKTSGADSRILFKWNDYTRTYPNKQYCL